VKHAGSTISNYFFSCRRQFSELNLEKKSDAEKADIVKKVKEAIMTRGAVAGALAHHFTTIEG